MKFFLFALFFNLSLQAYAETTTIILNALPGHTENGKIVVTSQQQPHNFEWDLNGLNPSQHFYGFLLYENGDCSNYSSQLGMPQHHKQANTPGRRRKFSCFQ